MCIRRIDFKMPFAIGGDFYPVIHMFFPIWTASILSTIKPHAKTPRGTPWALKSQYEQKDSVPYEMDSDNAQKSQGVEIIQTLYQSWWHMHLSICVVYEM